MNGRARSSSQVTVGLLLVLLGTGCTGLRFRHAQIVESLYDDAEGATRVDVRFSVVDERDRPVNDLRHEHFGIREDRVGATSESFSLTNAETPPVGITVLLDSSKSMYDAGLAGSEDNAVMEIKRLANDFVASLHDQGPYEFEFYRFSSDLMAIATVDEVLDTYSPAHESGEERWTALYHAIHEAIDRHPDNVIVVFSDGADNYSQNRGGIDLDRVAEQIRGRRTPVFAIGSGNSEKEYDRQGVSGARALRKLCRYGAMRLATEPGALQELLRDIENQVRAVYTINYYSPNLSGEHDLRIRVTARDRRGTSPWLSFQGGESP